MRILIAFIVMIDYAFTSELFLLAPKSLLGVVNEEISRRKIKDDDNHFTQSPMVWTFLNQPRGISLSETGFNPEVIRKGLVSSKVPFYFLIAQPFLVPLQSVLRRPEAVVNIIAARNEV
ncbi:hypothetical protein FOL47_002730 [Perkinsus chesapeaki]|uniref:Uncharacterized protein n=1 Tax=Perkinsus chesapeaki TaxID=330153 RepID=A0A7J6KP66_PERCH|nr:hypothetical protein FOL47_002730 [Perkinsus chesapeaki]